MNKKIIIGVVAVVAAVVVLYFLGIFGGGNDDCSPENIAAMTQQISDYMTSDGVTDEQRLELSGILSQASGAEPAEVCEIYQETIATFAE
jgi:hypothetical protein